MATERGAALAGRWAGLRARWRRDRGRYDRATLIGYWAAWRASGSAPALLRLATFRRDLGRPLPGRWIAPLRDAAPALAPNVRRLALGLLAEAAPASLVTMPPQALADAAVRIPALAARGPAPCTPAARRLAQLHDEQADRRAAFADWLARRRDAGGLCVVGNAATLRGGTLGTAIDAHAAVLRFNAFRGDADPVDIGRRTDVWVAKGDYRGERPAGIAWAVHSGPDPRFRVVDPETLALLAGEDTPVLTVPLAVWRTLVRELEAPPSAGLLTLAWLRTLLGGWEGLHCAGIGGGLGPGGRYHAAIAAKPPGRRHAWAREQALLARWQAEGLRCLDR
ncbi:MAG TPA: glycosyltransferase family 29 protein [Methylibium sp.]|nr:glycosyltransferase family 29 protein [Methylibium sp.]